jgi:xanthine/CO dehydrogenase XdhC/CoxF family maturation factor
MTDLEPILALARELQAARQDYVLATVVAVEGSSYRKPGACMLLAADGRRAGTISGGCLEAEVARRAFWLTAHGPVVERYSTVADDGEMPFGSGCGGAVHLLLEHAVTAAQLLAALGAVFHARAPLAVATVLDGALAGQRAFSPSGDTGALAALAAQAFTQQHSSEQIVELNGSPARIWCDYRPARPGLHIFGAGDDALPLVSFARELGWFVSVADGRAHLATRARFPRAHQVDVLPISAGTLALPGILPTDAAVLITHSFEQDARILAALLALDAPPAYIGVLGPQRRTREVLAESAHLRGLAPSIDRVERELARLNAPTGLDLGAATPAAIALSILAEVQQTLTGASALPLRTVRAAHEAVPHR